MAKVIGELTTAVAVSILALGFTYYVVLVWLGWRASRAGQTDAADPLDGAAVLFLVPCLDEELVIGETVRNLLDGDSTAVVVVIDDASADRTAETAVEAGGDRVVICRRELPDARLGKGPALNQGFREVIHQVRLRGLDPERVVVGVMDADGRLSPGAVRHVLSLFSDPRVGGAQLGVRIRNKGSLLTNMQDFEFWGISALAQLARSRTHSVSLGGNGQFTRLTALMQLGDQPWSRALTEDLDLAISLQLKGWRLTSTPLAWVSQQGVETVKALIRQRTRWFQGHMQCSARTGEIWRCMELSNTTAMETAMYLLSPILLALPWSIIFNLALVDTWYLHSMQPTFEIFGSELIARVVRTGGWYVVSFLPAFVSAFIYSRRERSATIGQALLYAHVLVAYTYITWYCCWLAVARIATGRNGWVKTARHSEATAASAGA